MKYFDQIVENVKREKDDCAIVAVAAVAGTSYLIAADMLAKHGRQPNDGAYDDTIITAIKSLIHCRPMEVKSKCKTLRTFARQMKSNIYLVTTVDHVAAVRYGEIVDDQSDLARIERIWLIASA